MKIALSIIFIFLSSSSLFSQKNKIVKINSFDIAEGFFKIEFMYPGYLDGMVHFKDNSNGEAKMNYNLMTNQIYFLNPKGDTLIIAHPETSSEITIGQDTFYFHQKGFVQKYTHNENTINLYVRPTMKYIGKEKRGAYGTYSGATAANSLSTFSTDNQVTTYLALDENLLYEKGEEFYLCDTLNNLFPANKSSLYAAFPQYVSLIKAFLKNNKIDFYKKDNLLFLLDYIQSLKKNSLQVK